MSDFAQLAYYVLGCAGVLGAGVAWVWRHFDARLTKLQADFNDHRVQASEKFASATAMSRLEIKIDEMGNRILHTLLELFSKTPRKED